MAQREPFRVIPDRRRSSVGEGRNHADVDAIADGCVVRDVALRFISQEVQRYWVDTRSDAIRRDVSCIDLRRIQTAETGWRACRTRRIACATRRAMTNDALC